MSILKDRIRPLDPSSNQEFLEPDRKVRAEAGSPQTNETASAGQVHTVTRDAESFGTGE
jgi:hypothetical protein